MSIAVVDVGDAESTVAIELVQLAWVLFTETSALIARRLEVQLLSLLVENYDRQTIPENNTPLIYQHKKRKVYTKL